MSNVTPAWVQQTLYQLYADLPDAQQALAVARDLEMDAKHAYDRARRHALLDPAGPKVSRGGWTTAERDAWVEQEASDERAAYDTTVVLRETAQDHLRTLRDQAEIVRSLGVSVRLDAELAALAQPG